MNEKKKRKAEEGALEKGVESRHGTQEASRAACV